MLLSSGSGESHICHEVCAGGNRTAPATRVAVTARLQKRRRVCRALYRHIHTLADRRFSVGNRCWADAAGSQEARGPLFAAPLVGCMAGDCMAGDCPGHGQMQPHLRLALIAVGSAVKNIYEKRVLHWLSICGCVVPRVLSGCVLQVFSRCRGTPAHDSPLGAVWCALCESVSQPTWRLRRLQVTTQEHEKHEMQEEKLTSLRWGPIGQHCSEWQRSSFLFLPCLNFAKELSTQHVILYCTQPRSCLHLTACCT